MNLSSFVYDLYDEFMNFGRVNIQGDCARTAAQTYKLIQMHEKTCGILLFQTTKLELERDRLTVEIVESQDQLAELTSERVRRGLVCEVLTSKAISLEDFERRMNHEFDLKKKLVLEKYEESRAKIISNGGRLAPRELEVLRARNRELRAEIEHSILLLRKKKTSHIRKMRKLDVKESMILESIDQRRKETELKSKSDLKSLKDSTEVRRINSEFVRYKIPVFFQVVRRVLSALELKRATCDECMVNVKLIIDGLFVYKVEKSTAERRLNEINEIVREIYLEVS
jgi:hypothetical protein